MAEKDNSYIKIGVIASPHGIKGEVNVYPTTDDIHRFSSLSTCWFKEKNVMVEKKVISVKYFKKMVILGFEDIKTRNESELLRKKEIYVDRNHAEKLSENEYFISDIIGLKAYNESDEEFGKITDYIETGAGIVLIIIDEQGNEHMVPANPEFINKVYLKEKKVVLHLIRGM